MSQEDLILNHLKLGYSITPLEALQKWGVFRLGARCFNLRKKGYNIKSEIVKSNGKHYSKYYLASNREE